jgi:hypothetical protein
MLATLGIPPASQMRDSAAQVRTFAESPSHHFVNIKLAATEPAMIPTYVSDAIAADGTVDFTMRLDVRALATSNGPTTTGRRATVLAAKLFLLSMAENVSTLSSGRYRLRVEFVGLPSQTGLPGTVLSAKTIYAYSAASPILAALRKEILNVEKTCPSIER